VAKRQMKAKITLPLREGRNLRSKFRGGVGAPDSRA
jgi:hypothetical protein